MGSLPRRSQETMSEYRIAERWPASGWPIKSQFFLLCVATHNKNYAECSVMRSARFQRGRPPSVMAAFPASGVIWSGVKHEIPATSSRVSASGRLGRGASHNSRGVFVISARSRVCADHHRPLRGLPPGRSKGSGSTKKEPAGPFSRRGRAFGCSVELEAWRAPIADVLPRGLASVGIISWGRSKRLFGRPGCRMAELDR